MDISAKGEKRLSVRITKSNKQLLKKMADSSGLSMSALVDYGIILACQKVPKEIGHIYRLLCLELMRKKLGKKSFYLKSKELIEFIEKVRISKKQASSILKKINNKAGILDIFSTVKANHKKYVTCYAPENAKVIALVAKDSFSQLQQWADFYSKIPRCSSQLEYRIYVTFEKMKLELRELADFMQELEKLENRGIAAKGTWNFSSEDPAELRQLILKINPDFVPANKMPDL
jgi:hypothetical protein